MFFKPPDNAVEQFYLKEDLLHTRIAILVSICFCLLFIRNDYLFYGTGSMFYLTISVRAVFVAISLGAFYFLRQARTFQQHERIVYIWGIFYLLLTIYINVSRQASNINFTYLDTVAVLLILLIFPGRIWVKAIFAGFLTLSDFIILAFFKTLTADVSLEVIVYSYFLAFFLGTVIAVKYRQFRYEQYYALEKEQGLRLELEKFAYTDYLTGALNRRKFFELADAVFAQYKEHQTVFSVIMLDLDFFKKLNDEFGHKGGDAFLLEFTRIIKENMRSSDVFGRLGGEEFALILPTAKFEYASQKAERLRELCENGKVVVDHNVLQTTVSIGITEVWQQDKSFYDVLSRADEALYQAKRKGRNRVQLKLIKK